MEEVRRAPGAGGRAGGRDGQPRGSVGLLLRGAARGLSESTAPFLGTAPNPPKRATLGLLLLRPLSARSSWALVLSTGQ